MGRRHRTGLTRLSRYLEGRWLVVAALIVVATTSAAAQSGGWLLVAFHVSRAEPGHQPGDIMHAEQWWGEQVDLDFYYLDPVEVVAGLAASGFEVVARTDREPWPGVEQPSREALGAIPHLARTRGRSHERAVFKEAGAHAWPKASATCRARA